MKSLLVNVMFPSWVWIDAPHERFLCIGSADDLPTRDSLKCRRLIESPWYQQRWGDVYQLQADQNAKTKYETDKTGVRGIGSFAGSILGERAGFILVDDPHKTDLAESDTVRENKLVKFREEIYGRREDENSVIVIIMQRLNERDLAGFVLAEGWADAHVCIPMRYEERRKVWVTAVPGEALRTPIRARSKASSWRRCASRSTRWPSRRRCSAPSAPPASSSSGPVPRGGGIVSRENFRFYRKADLAFRVRHDRRLVGLRLQGHEAERLRGRRQVGALGRPASTC
jgi:hypothetical protein